MTSIYDISALVGLLTIAYLGYKAFEVVQFIFHSSKLYRYAHNPNPNLKLDRQLSKPWALITGASDGIGKALAQELCSRGFNVVIHGRPGSKLEKVKSELERDFNADVRLMAIDASDPSIWNNFDQKVLGVLDGINLTVVINNLGGGAGVSPATNTVTDHTRQEDEIFISANLRFMTYLNRITIPILDQNSPGLIMNMSSAGEYMPMPYFVIYSGCKAYVRQYSRSLRAELKLKKKDVECVSITVGSVVTDGSGRTANEENLATPNARNYAKAVLNKVGYDSPSYVPYIPHHLMLKIALLLPWAWVENRMASAMEDQMVKHNPRKKTN